MYRYIKCTYHQKHNHQYYYNRLLFQHLYYKQIIFVWTLHRLSKQYFLITSIFNFTTAGEGGQDLAGGRSARLSVSSIRGWQGHRHGGSDTSVSDGRGVSPAVAASIPLCRSCLHAPTAGGAAVCGSGRHSCLCVWVVVRATQVAWLVFVFVFIDTFSATYKIVKAYSIYSLDTSGKQTKI